jgi:type 1 glutamine amidotransferase
MKRSLSLLAFSLLAATAFAAEGGKKTVVMIAGHPSHGHGEHEHNAGVLLLTKCLNEGASSLVVVKDHLNAEWPSEEELGAADTILIYSDGGGGHPAIQGDHLQQLAKEMKRGCGFVCLHYAVEIPKDKGGPEFLQWLGGYFEENWSVNPTWQAEFQPLPKMPVTNGVNAFSSFDEWYFHMRFPDDQKGLTRILQAVPPASTMSRKDGPHEGNPTVRAEVAENKLQTTSWAYERQDGSNGRGFGFTGGHFHKGWGNDEQRKLVLNAIVWTAHGEVPAGGIESHPTAEDLTANLDPKK